MASTQTYETVWLKTALKQASKLPGKDRTKIVGKIRELKENLSSLDTKKLKGYSDTFRIKCGNYRIIYVVRKQSKIIYIAIVAHRKEVYKNLKLLSQLLASSQGMA